MSRGSSSSPMFGGGRGLYVGRLFQIEFYLDYSWFLIAAILTYTLTNTEFPRQISISSPHLILAPKVYLMMGLSGALLFFLSIILHELGHSLVSQRCGIPVPRITLLFIGGLAEISREPDDARSELKIALGGPVVSVILALLFAGLSWLADVLGWLPVSIVLGWLAVTNVALVIFNMVPGYPLDGGRILRALLWAKSGKLRRATFITSRIGIGFSWILFIGGVFMLLVQKQWNGLPLVVIAIFLMSAAQSGYTHAINKEVLAGVSARDVMTANPVCIPADLPLTLVVDDFFLTNHHVAFPVIGSEGEFRGVIRLEFLKGVPRERWPYMSAGDLAADRETESLRLEASASAARAMRSLLTADSGRMAVTDNGKVVGMITRHDILHFIEIHTELE